MDRILVGDALETLRTLPANSVHCCATSPPYWALRNYGVDGQIGLEETPEHYVSRIVDVFREVRRVLHPSGTLWLNLGDSFAGGGRGPTGHNGIGDQDKRQGDCLHGVTPDGLKPKDLVGIPWMVAFALRADGWYLRSDIIWAKDSCMPESVTDRPTKAHEYVFLMSKSERYFYDIDAVREPSSQPERSGKIERTFSSGDSAVTLRQDTGRAVLRTTFRNRRSVWRINPEPFHGAHFACWPTKLVEPMILAGTSAHGCCEECGAPWVRVVEVSGLVNYGGYRKRADAPGAETSSTSMFRTGNVSVKQTTGWQPTCKHSADVVPCTVLDPFSGAGTTGLVARRHGRAYIGIELNPKYARMALRRIDNDASLLNPRGIEVREAV